MSWLLRHSTLFSVSPFPRVFLFPFQTPPTHGLSCLCCIAVCSWFSVTDTVIVSAVYVLCCTSLNKCGLRLKRLTSSTSVCSFSKLLHLTLCSCVPSATTPTFCFAFSGWPPLGFWLSAFCPHLSFLFDLQACSWAPPGNHMWIVYSLSLSWGVLQLKAPAKVWITSNRALLTPKLQH